MSSCLVRWLGSCWFGVHMLLRDVQLAQESNVEVLWVSKSPCSIWYRAGRVCSGWAWRLTRKYQAEWLRFRRPVFLRVACVRRLLNILTSFGLMLCNIFLETRDNCSVKTFYSDIGVG